LQGFFRHLNQSIPSDLKRKGNWIMISDKDLLFIEPQAPASSAPLIDSLTRRMTAAYRFAQPSSYHFCGVHQCICGACSSSCDYFLPDGVKTNSLCVHYLAYHREAVPGRQMARVAKLKFGEADPSEEELRGGRWRGNRPSDYFGKAKLAQFANGGIDLALIYLAAEDTPQCHELFRHALSNFWDCPEEAVTEFLSAVRQTHGDVRLWAAQAFWPAGWKEAWVSPLLTLLGHAESNVRAWAATSLGNIGDTQTRWGLWASADQVNWVQATGIPRQPAQAVGRALLDIGFKDRDERVRSAALRALEQIGPLPASSVRTLLEILHAHPQEPGHRVASEALQVIGLQGEDAAAVLIAVMRTRADARTRQAVAAALERIGSKVTLQASGMGCPLSEEGARQLMRVMLTHPDDSACSAARDALQAIGVHPETAGSVLGETIRKNTDKELRLAALNALRTIGPAAKAAIPVLVELLRDRDPEIPKKTWAALDQIGSYATQAVPVLAQALQDESKTVRIRAARFLGELGPEASAAIPALQMALQDIDLDVRTNVRHTLKTIESKSTTA
jgi:HEAT repeat protein